MGVIDDAVNAILDTVGDYIAYIAEKVAEAVQALFGPAINQVFSFFNSLINSLQSQLSNIGSFINSIIDQVLLSVSDVIEQVATFAKSLFDGFLTQVADVFDSIVSQLEDIGQRIYDFVSGALDAITEFVQNVGDRIFSVIDAGIEVVKQFALDVYNTVVQAVSDLFVSARETLADLSKIVQDNVSALLSTGRDVVNDIEDAVKRFTASVTDEIGATLTTLVKGLEDLPDQVDALASDLFKSAKENIAEPISKIAGDLVDKALTAFSSVAPEVLDRARQALFAAVSAALLDSNKAPEISRRLEDALPDQPVLRTIMTTVASLIMVLQVPLALSQIGAQQVVYGHSVTNPWQRLGLPMLAQADRRELLDTSTAELAAREQGFSSHDYKVARELTRSLVPPGELLQWFYRGLINIDQLTAILKISGYSEEDVPNIISASELIPPVQDLITMAVREAFSPDVAERFGQFQDFPEAFAEHAAAQGLTGDWARRYWAAHWGLPSPQMGFEMLHRGIISEDELKLLLRALDVMPFWREKVIQLSFAPYTRVDIRRMHQVGVLSDDEVHKAHLELGYNEDKAKKLTAFVIKLNSPGGDDNPERARELQQATILKFFRDGVFDDVKAIQLLRDLGFTADLASILVHHAAIQDAAEERKADIELIIEQAKAGLLTFAQAQTELGKVGAEQGEIQKALATVLRATRTQTKLPSRSELDRFATQGLIEADEYIATLQLLGYSERWARLFAISLGVKNAEQT